MARLRFDLHVTGVLSNDSARQFVADVEAFQQSCAESGLDVRGHGCDVVFDDEPVADEAAPVVPVGDTPEPDAP